MDLLKSGISMIVSYGVGEIVSNAVKNTTPNDISKFKKAGVAVGGVALGYYISDKVSEYIVDKINEATESFRSTIDELQKTEEEDIDDDATENPEFTGEFQKE